MSRRLFTAASANRTLPLVRRIVADILEKGRRLRELSIERGSSGHEELERLGREIREHMNELEALGCEYKDWSFEFGLVDFPAIIDGRRVQLCWRSDEPKITWYHSEEAGFAGRMPIPSSELEDDTSREDRVASTAGEDEA